jgi:hypothetical protein
MRPNAEPGAAIQVRLSGSDLNTLENWRRAQEKIPPRSEALREAIRRLVTAPSDYSPEREVAHERRD